ncbi:MAG TPA: hypothetical protein VF060_07220 [Trebonia sp.]
MTADPALVSLDLDHGGRWTSLRMGGREWLWRRDEPRRARVAPGDAFADAGGIEECVPTVRGGPDHGDAWSRAWHATDDDGAEVRCDDFTLRRWIMPGDGRVTARYRLSADPGYRFVWAAHALLDVSPLGVLRISGRPDVRLYPEAAAFLDEPWPPGEPFVTACWPGPGGLRLDRLGPDDGTAVGAIVQGCAEVTVRDGDGPGLRMRVTPGAGLPAPVTSEAPVTSVAPVTSEAPVTSVALWRNLGGFPDGRPYRSIGVEPMLGSVFDLAEARLESDAVTVPRAGYVEWELEIGMALS